MRQKYEVYIRESAITTNNHLKPIEVVECDFMIYDRDMLQFGDIEENNFMDSSGEITSQVAIRTNNIRVSYNWSDIIKLVRLS